MTEANAVHVDYATLSIPSVDINAPIIPLQLKSYPDGTMTWDTASLAMAVGHLSGLPWFGEGGNIVLGGHSELHRGMADVFYDLDKVSVGDEIHVRLGREKLRYEVISIENVAKWDTTILRPSTAERLTLMTCDVDTFDYDTGDYPHRVVVIAERIQ